MASDPETCALCKQLCGSSSSSSTSSSSPVTSGSSGSQRLQVLPCLHAFCRQCVERQPRCPLCEWTGLQCEGGEEPLPVTSFLLSGLLDAVAAAEETDGQGGSEPRPAQCSPCEERNPASSYCLDCQVRVSSGTWCVFMRGLTNQLLAVQLLFTSSL